MNFKPFIQILTPIPALAGQALGQGFLTLALFWIAPRVFSAAATWHVPAADLRFELAVRQRPSQAAAGVIAVVPDGGLLPKFSFRPAVVDADGKVLNSETLWHNPTEGLAFVFEPPPADTVFFYPVPAEAGPKPAASFRPSVLLYVRNGNASLEQARALADKPPVGNDIYFAVVDRIFHSLLPVGRDHDSSAYYSGWFNVAAPGRRYFYTISQDGSEFFIDGALVHSWPGRHNRQGGQLAEHGNWVNLAPGMHQARYFHFSLEAAGRESQLGWTPPEGRPKKDGRTMAAGDFVHSGLAAPVKASSRQGPLAAFTFARESVINPGKELSLFRFRGLGDNPPPAGTTYEWDFGDQRKVKGREAAWLYAGTSNQQVTLTATTGAQVSRCTRVFFLKAPIPAQLLVTQPETRRLYSEALLTMCRAAPAGQRPCAAWDEALWQALFAVIESPLKAPLLQEMFERSLPDLQGLPATNRWALEEKFVLALSQTNPASALAWLDRLEKADADAGRVRYWEAARIDIYLYELNDLTNARAAAMKFLDIAAATEKARAAAEQFLAKSAEEEKISAARKQFMSSSTGGDKARAATERFMESTSWSAQNRAFTEQSRTAAAAANQSVLAIIRVGDVERISGNLEEARRLYALAQKTQQKLAPKKREVVSGATPAAAALAAATNRPALLARPTQTNKPAAARKHVTLGGSLPAADPGGRRPSYPLVYENIQEWKITAVHEAAYYATVKNLIQQRALDEARRTLEQWEMEIPLSKLSGDYPLALARYCMALQLYRRAQRILHDYRESVDLTNYLPEAMKMEFDCLTALGQPAAAMKLAQIIIKRLPNHPLAEEARLQLRMGDATPLSLDQPRQSRALTPAEQARFSKIADLFKADDEPAETDSAPPVKQAPAPKAPPPPPAAAPRPAPPAAASKTAPESPAGKVNWDRLTDLLGSEAAPAESAPDNRTPQE